MSDLMKTFAAAAKSITTVVRVAGKRGRQPLALSDLSKTLQDLANYLVKNATSGDKVQSIKTGGKWNDKPLPVSLFEQLGVDDDQRRKLNRYLRTQQLQLSDVQGGKAAKTNGESNFDGVSWYLIEYKKPNQK